MKHTQARGLSLIETLLVLVVISIVILMGAGQYQRYSQQRTIAAAQHAVQELFTYNNNVYQKVCVQLFDRMINVSGGSLSTDKFTCTSDTSTTTACYGLPNFVNPFFNRSPTYQVDQIVIAKKPSRLVVYLPVGYQIASKPALFAKYKGILRPTKSASKGGCAALGGAIGGAGGDGCFMWEGAPANYGNVATKTQASAGVAVNLDVHQVDEEPSSDVLKKMLDDGHYQLQRRNFGESRRCTLLEYKNIQGTLSVDDFKDPM